MLPKCEDKPTTALLNEIITELLVEAENQETGNNPTLSAMSKVARATKTKFVAANNIRELGFNETKQIRVCKASILYSNGDEENITYNISWLNKKKFEFWVEVIGEE